VIWWLPAPQAWAQQPLPAVSRNDTSCVCCPISRCTPFGFHLVRLPEPSDPNNVGSLEQHLAVLLPSTPAASEPNSGGNTSQWHQQHQQLAGALQRRIQHNIQLAARCSRLESEKQQLAGEKQDLSDKLARAQVGCVDGCQQHSVLLDVAGHLCWCRAAS
jgi:hypothetical protein